MEVEAISLFQHEIIQIKSKALQLKSFLKSSGSLSGPVVPQPVHTLKARIFQPEKIAELNISTSSGSESKNSASPETYKHMYGEERQSAPTHVLGSLTTQNNLTLKEKNNKGQKCTTCGSESKETNNFTTNYSRPSNEVEIECLRRRIDELCEDNQILYNNLEDYKHALGYLVDKHRNLVHSIRSQRDVANLNKTLLNDLEVEKKRSKHLEFLLARQKQDYSRRIGRLNALVEHEIIQSAEEDEVFYKLAKENNVLRNVLGINYDYSKLANELQNLEMDQQEDLDSSMVQITDNTIAMDLNTSSEHDIDELLVPSQPSTHNLVDPNEDDHPEIFDSSSSDKSITPEAQQFDTTSDMNHNTKSLNEPPLNEYRKHKNTQSNTSLRSGLVDKQRLLRNSGSTADLGLPQKQSKKKVTAVRQERSTKDLLDEFRKIKQERHDKKTESPQKKKLTIEDLLKLNLDELGTIDFDLDDLDLEDLNRLKADVSY